MTGKWLIRFGRAGEQLLLDFADAARVAGAAQTRTCRNKLVVSVNTSSDLRVRGREQMTSYLHQRDGTEASLIRSFYTLVPAVNKID